MSRAGLGGISLSSSRAVEPLEEARLEGLRSRKRHVLAKRSEFPRLLGDLLKLTACMFGRNLNKFCRRFHASQPLDKFEGGLRVGVSEFNEFAVIILHPFDGLRITICHDLGRFSRSGTDSL